MKHISFFARLRKSLFLGGLFCLSSITAEEVLPLEVISYEDLMQENPDTLCALRNALYNTGIVGIRGVPGYQQKVEQFVQRARAFVALPDSVKDSYAPNHEQGDLFLGYEKGKEKFKRPDGTWVVDDLKVSYYAFIPDDPSNKWPREVDLKASYQDLGVLMAQMGKIVMEKIGLIGNQTGIVFGSEPQVGRLLYYQGRETYAENPYWCGAHFDHGVFTALTPATYFKDGQEVAEPEEAGLFVNIGGSFKKVKSDPEVMLFQVGEFGQLATNDAIRATEHRVHKALGSVERFALAVFFNAPMETVIHSSSKLTQDSRYGGKSGDPCTYQQWHEESFKRYIVK